jgi:regulatory protein
MWKKSSQIEKITEPDKLRSRALYWISRKEYSIKALYEKLEGICDDEIMVADLMEDFIQRDWVNNERFMASFTRLKMNSGLGQMRIKRELTQQGIKESDVNMYFEASEFDWFEQALNTYQKKYGDSPCEDYKERAKRFRFMQYRGFNSDQIKYAMQDQSSDW